MLKFAFMLFPFLFVAGFFITISSKENRKDFFKNYISWVKTASLILVICAIILYVSIVLSVG